MLCKGYVLYPEYVPADKRSEDNRVVGILKFATEHSKVMFQIPCAQNSNILNTDLSVHNLNCAGRKLINNGVNVEIIEKKHKPKS